MAEQLAGDVEKAVKMVQGLTTAGGEVPKGTERMPRGEIAQCAGLAFTFVKKGGAVVTVTGGHGFVIKKLTSADGKTSWSAPYFIKVQSAGLGLTLGFSEVESVTVLDSPEAVRAFAGGQWTVDTEMSGTAGALVGHPVGGHVSATAVNVSDTKLSDKTFSYSVAKGVLIDVSWTGVRYSPDADMNKAVYGTEGDTPDSVMDSGVAAPPAMQPLFAALDQVIADFAANPTAE